MGVTHDTPEDLREMARTRVADVERDLDQAARRLKARPLLRSVTARMSCWGRVSRSRVTNWSAPWPSPAWRPAWEGWRLS